LDEAAALRDFVPTGGNPEEARYKVESMFKSLSVCGINEAIEIAKQIPGTTLTGPPPTSVKDAVKTILEALIEAGYG
jgi:hypothetical protein